MSTTSALPAGAPVISIDQPTFIMAAHKKVQENETATNWLVCLGIFFLLLGIVLQLMFRSWWYSVIWIIGIIFMISGAIVYATGANLRSCLANPALCQAMMQVMASYN